MAKDDKREEARRLYAQQAMSCQAIAEELGVDPGTVYRWKAEASLKGEAIDWESQRRIYHMSPRELMAIYAECVKTWIVMLKAEPEKLADPKIADAICKHISSLQKIDPRSQYLGVAIDLIKAANKWLAEHDPALKEKMDPLWDQIMDALNKELTGKDLF